MKRRVVLVVDEAIAQQAYRQQAVSASEFLKKLKKLEAKEEFTEEEANSLPNLLHGLTRERMGKDFSILAIRMLDVIKKIKKCLPNMRPRYSTISDGTKSCIGQCQHVLALRLTDGDKYFADMLHERVFGLTENGKKRKKGRRK